MAILLSLLTTQLIPRASLFTLPFMLLAKTCTVLPTSTLTAGMAVACSEEGLRTITSTPRCCTTRIAYHDFEGITVMDDEKPRLLANMGDKNMLILRNHGLLTCGRTIPEAFMNMWALQRSCEFR